MSWFSDQRWHVPGCACTTDDNGYPIDTDPTCLGWSGVVRKASEQRDAEVAADARADERERIALAIEEHKRDHFYEHTSNMRVGLDEAARIARKVVQ